MRKTIATMAMMAVVCTGFAQKIANPKPFATTISRDDLKKHLFIVASAEMEGRETATEGQRKAAAYIENNFKSLGLAPANHGEYQVKYPVYKDTLSSAKMMINDTAFVADQDFQPINNFARPGQLYVSEVVFAGHGIVDSTYDDYDGLDVRGKMVMILDGAPSSYKPSVTGFQSPANNNMKLRNAAKKGAAAVLIVSASFPRTASRQPAPMYLRLYAPSVMPVAVSISEKVAAAIAGPAWSAIKEQSKTQKLASGKFTTNVMLDITKQITMLQSSDVVGVLEGTDLKDQYVYVTAHYDHLGKRDSVIYYGADDDGSGTVSVLEIAEAFAKAKAAGKGPRRTMVFMTVSGEEKGLWGSEYYTDHPLFPLDKTTVDLNIDMVGRIDPNRKKGDSTNYVYVVGDDKLSTDLKPISESINKKYTNLELDYMYNDPKDQQRIYYRSDHYNFARKGVPIIFYFDGIHKDYHKPSDTPDKINYDIMEKRARLVFYTAWEMANRNDMLKRDLTLDVGTR
jgi:Zn-dependent M28 family amino/carboxypeptidase